MKWLKELGCKVFGHFPAFASTTAPGNHCMSCKAPMAWSPALDSWVVTEPAPHGSTKR
jgi:hypothetical protein